MLTVLLGGMNTVLIDLMPGVTWDSIGAISVWCELAAANFGSVMLEEVQERMGPVGNRECEDVDVLGEARYMNNLTYVTTVLAKAKALF